jgi:hypothetical protein
MSRLVRVVRHARAGEGQHGTVRADAAERVGVTPMVGFDETVMQPAYRRRRRRLVTAVVDVTCGQILDVVEGHNASDLRDWLASSSRGVMPAHDEQEPDAHD